MNAKRQCAMVASVAKNMRAKEREEKRKQKEQEKKNNHKEPAFNLEKFMNKQFNALNLQGKTIDKALNDPKSGVTQQDLNFVNEMVSKQSQGWTNSEQEEKELYEIHFKVAGWYLMEEFGVTMW